MGRSQFKFASKVLCFIFIALLFSSCAKRNDGFAPGNPSAGEPISPTPEEPPGPPLLGDPKQIIKLGQSVITVSNWNVDFSQSESVPSQATSSGWFVEESYE